MLTLLNPKMKTNCMILLVPKPYKTTNQQVHSLTLLVPSETTNNVRGTQREYSSKPLKHSNVERILVFKR